MNSRNTKAADDAARRPPPPISETIVGDFIGCIALVVISLGLPFIVAVLT